MHLDDFGKRRLDGLFGIIKMYASLSIYFRLIEAGD